MCRFFPDGSHFKDLDTSDRRKRGLSGDRTSIDIGTSAEQRTCDDVTRDRTVSFIRSLSCSASSNDSELVNKNYTSNSNYVECAPTSLKPPVIVDASGKEVLERKEEERDGENSQLPSEQVIRTWWNDYAESSRRNRRKRRNVNASTQTLPTVEELDDTLIDDCDEGAGRNEGPDHTEKLSRSARTDNTEDGQAAVRRSERDVDKEEIQSYVTDILRLMLAPVIDADRQQINRGSHSPTAARRCFHPHHHHHHQQQQHHHHHYHQQCQPHQRRLNEYNYNQSNRQTVHSYPSACASCNMRQDNFQDAVVIRSTRSTLVNSRQVPCPKCSKVVRGRSVAFAQRSPTAVAVTPSTANQPPPPVEPDARPAGSVSRSAAPAGGRPLTEEALRQRIERVLVEMIPRNDDGQENKVTAALRQAIVDSAAFPTLFTD